MNLKGYICNFHFEPYPNLRQVNCDFTSDPNKAWRWETKDEAERGCAIVNGYNLEIPANYGGTYICRDFKCERLGSGEFVLCCEAPFIRKGTPVAA